MVYIAIEGLIGAGKSTILKQIEWKHNEQVFEEKLDKWRSLLCKYYKDPHRWAFELQMTILSVYIEMSKDITEENFVTERSIIAVMAFTKTLVKMGFLDNSQYKIFELIFKTLERKDPDYIIYLSTNVPDSMNRIKIRLQSNKNRSGEEEIGIKYMEMLEESYKEIFDEYGYKSNLFHVKNVKEMENALEEIYKK